MNTEIIGILSFVAISLMTLSLCTLFARAGMLLRYNDRYQPNHIRIIASIMKWFMIVAVIISVIIGLIMQYCKDNNLIIN